MESQAEGRAAAGGLATRWVELVVALVIVGGGALVIKDSMRIGTDWGPDGPEGGYFPFLTGWSLALSGLWLTGHTLWNWRRMAGQVFASWSALRPVLAMLLPTIAFVVLIKLIGIYVASAIFIGAFMMWQGKYKLLPALAVAIAIPAAVFLLFELWFLVPLPKGPVERLFGY
ncbi:MAG: tripartite tricarboxylate transporter TctB family protein [Betaproteobacteria bacterium]|jgi:putative tricarboxylic transport membrane protein|nr:tripartite tricarboxylate transporter TctB family protein [Betaproteobacteria bacterium]